LSWRSRPPSWSRLLVSPRAGAPVAIDDAVGGDLLARMHDELVAHGQHVDVDLFVQPVAQDGA
jgi:hypothetical protein